MSRKNDTHPNRAEARTIYSDVKSEFVRGLIRGRSFGAKEDEERKRLGFGREGVEDVVQLEHLIVRGVHSSGEERLYRYLKDTHPLEWWTICRELAPALLVKEWKDFERIHREEEEEKKEKENLENAERRDWIALGGLP